MQRAQILKLILGERDRQDAQWGGPAHDAQHGGEEWHGFIQHQLDSMRDPADGSLRPTQYRSRLVKIAALAFAALECLLSEKGSNVPNTDPREIHILMDGSAWQARREDFINSVESTSGWGESPLEAFVRLLAEEADANA